MFDRARLQQKSNDLNAVKATHNKSRQPELLSAPSSNQNAILQLQQQRGNVYTQRYIASLSGSPVQRTVIINEIDTNNAPAMNPGELDRDSSSYPPRGDTHFMGELGPDGKQNPDYAPLLSPSDSPDPAHPVEEEWDKDGTWHIAPDISTVMALKEKGAIPQETQNDSPVPDIGDFPRPVAEVGKVAGAIYDEQAPFVDPTLQPDPDDPYAETAEQQVIDHLEDKNPRLKQQMDQYPSKDPNDSTDENAEKHLKSLQIWENQSEDN